MKRPRIALSIRAQLLLVLTVFLALPWLGIEYVRGVRTGVGGGEHLFDCEHGIENQPWQRPEAREHPHAPGTGR